MIETTRKKDTNIHLGYGDIIVSVVEPLASNEPCAGVRFNLAKKQHEIGNEVAELDVFKEGDEVSLHPAVNLMFHDKKSIDVVIDKLLWAKVLIKEKEIENEISGIQ